MKYSGGLAAEHMHIKEICSIQNTAASYWVFKSSH